MKIVLLDKETLGADADISVFKKFGEFVTYKTTKKEQTIERIKDADIVITNKVVIDQEVMDQAKSLKLICVAATGMNNVDLEYAKQKSIVVNNVAGYSTNSVVQHTFSLALYLIEKLNYYDEYVKSGGWIESEIFTHLQKPFWEINGKTWGIIGLGTIGKEVAKVAAAFGAEVLYYSTSGRNRDETHQRANLEELLKRSDIVSIHAPLNKQTYNLINKENLKLLKSGAVLLNLGRGGIINEKDLASFIDKSDILAGLDVLGKEPMSENHPLYHIQNKDRLFISPHLAWGSKEAREKLIEGIVNNIENFLKG